jgi:hypothetical protein
MNDNIKTNIKELKNNISELNFYLSYFQKIASSIDDNLSIIEESINKEKSNSSYNSDESDLLPKPSFQDEHKIPDEYYIDFSFIQGSQYNNWKEKLEQHSKDIAECRDKKQFLSFCFIGKQIIELSTIVFFEEEYNTISENNRRFFDAYLRVEERYRKKNWDLPKIYFPISESEKVEDESYKQLENNFIFWNKIEEIQRKLPTSIEIIFEMIQPNFINHRNSQIRNNFFNIKNMNKIRNIYTHESKDDFQERLKRDSHANKLYFNKNKFSLVQKSIEWFIEKIYTLLESHESKH